jgi:glycine dehydrogenase
MKRDSFQYRHIGPRAHEVPEMMKTIGVDSLEKLIDKTIPDNIRSKEELNLPPAMTEHEFMQHIELLGRDNKIFKSYIGLGYHDTIMPGVIQRNILENPGWYTAYTPYQAEIAQGRLEALLNFQTMVMELTGMDIANASLLDEGTAAAEAMSMLFHARSRDKKKTGANKFFVSELCLPQTIDILKTRSEPLGVELVIGNHESFTFGDDFFGAILQYPGKYGEVHDYADFVKTAKDKGIRVAVAADIMSLVLLNSPGSWGADVVVGTTQRFGIPLGYGGPHAAYFTTTEEFKRHVPGRIIGVSIDREGKPALRMALQTREQHIKRDRATSNICTAQVLLAVMAGMYGVYHGPEGLENIARNIHRRTVALEVALEKMGFNLTNSVYFDTIRVELRKVWSEDIRRIALGDGMNFYFPDDSTVCISINEATNDEDIQAIVDVFAKAIAEAAPQVEAIDKNALPDHLFRTDSFMQQKIFNSFHSETDMMRYIKRLERRDLALNHSMISLGSCTMKLNAATEMIPLTWPAFANIHPFAPVEQAGGYLKIFRKMERYLAEITGFDGTSLQPNSGAQGEYTGLMVIRQYHLSRGDDQRNVAIIPSSAHGTNPASAVMAGMKVVVVDCDKHGNIDVDDLRAKAEKYSDTLSALMITYPSTHGVFESSVKEITDIIHKNGGLVYMDGANMNAQVGLTSPGLIGADVCHLNLHKTFAIPHGGGGPGMGPICVTEKLVPFLPSHSVVPTGGTQGISSVSAAPWGSGLILLISYAYIRMLGAEGLTNSTKYAILNANYIKARLEKDYQILYAGESGHCAHEMILDCRPFKKTSGVEVTDIAKRLMDYGFHAPTVSFPVAGTLMVEPTESESKDELDRFCDAMLSIYNEMKEIENGSYTLDNNPLFNAPHTLELLTDDKWELPYSRQKAAYPLSWVHDNKFWPSVTRIDQAYGDRNLVCSCEPIESYMEEHEVI